MTLPWHPFLPASPPPDGDLYIVADMDDEEPLPMAAWRCGGHWYHYGGNELIESVTHYIEEPSLPMTPSAHESSAKDAPWAIEAVELLHDIEGAPLHSNVQDIHSCPAPRCEAASDSIRRGKYPDAELRLHSLRGEFRLFAESVFGLLHEIEHRGDFCDQPCCPACLVPYYYEHSGACGLINAKRRAAEILRELDDDQT